jgi:hypothetical protein
MIAVCVRIDIALSVTEAFSVTACVPQMVGDFGVFAFHFFESVKIRESCI